MNIYDIAREAGVSISTVSRVLNKKSNVTSATLEKVEAVLKKYDYTPSAIARGLVNNSMKTIAVLTVDVREPNHARTAYVIEREFSAKGYNVILCNTGGELEKTLIYLKTFAEKQVDGMILLGSVFNQFGAQTKVATLLRNIPVVLANGWLNIPNSYSVMVDDSEGIGLAVRHLYERDRRNIFYVKDLDTDSACHKLDGFLRAMKECGFSAPENNVVETKWGLEGGLEAAQRLHEMKQPVSAVVCGEDLTAVGVVKGFRKMGLRIPEDVAVTGFNNSEYARICEPELTCVDNKAEMVGQFSAQLLEHLLEGMGIFSSMVIQPELIIRNST